MNIIASIASLYLQMLLKIHFKDLYEIPIFAPILRSYVRRENGRELALRCFPSIVEDMVVLNIPI